MKPLTKRFSLISLAVVMYVSTVIYAAITKLSQSFQTGPLTDRPILAVLLLLGIAFCGYLAAIWIAARAPQSKPLLGMILFGAAAFRLVMVFSFPIQEVDIYRYLWDGAVMNKGVSPYRYSPQQVRQATHDESDEPLRRLARLRESRPALKEILHRIHFSHLPTIYPPVSQALFAVITHFTPPDASVWTRLVIAKTWFVLLDFATIGLVIGMLKLAKKPVGLCIIYAWCPLLIKETANSGHLDSLAVIFTALALYLFARLFTRSRFSSILPWLASAALAMGVGAKLFPIVLAPLFFAYFVRRFGWIRSLAPMILFTVATLAVLWPILPWPATAADIKKSSPTEGLVATEQPQVQASTGLTAFLRHWEINDFIFLLLIENLKPADQLPPGAQAWFSVIPESLRVGLADGMEAELGIPLREAPFRAARAITLAAFLIITFWLLRRVIHSTDLNEWLRSAFLILAWFWLLSPTQNPWYWTWVLPVLPFARSRAWLAMSGLVLLYYLRFWFQYHFPQEAVLGTGYAGVVFFDLVVTWIEFFPWFIALFCESLARGMQPLSRRPRVSPPLGISSGA